MDKVRMVARVNGAIGWLTVLIGVAAVLVLLSQFDTVFGRSGNAAVGVVVLIAAFLGAITPFSIWAGLTALCEIHDRQIELLAIQKAGSAAGRRTVESKPAKRPESREQAGGQPVEPPYDLEPVTDYPYAVGERVTVVKETMLHEGKQRPERAGKYVPANTGAKVLSAYESWLRVKTVHGDVGFVDAAAVWPGQV